MWTIEIKSNGILTGHIKLYPVGTGDESGWDWEYYEVGNSRTFWITHEQEHTNEPKLLTGHVVPKDWFGHNLCRDMFISLRFVLDAIEKKRKENNVDKPTPATVRCNLVGDGCGSCVHYLPHEVERCRAEDVCHSSKCSHIPAKKR